MVVTNGTGTAYRVHHGLLVGVVELFTEFTTGYWWGSWNCSPSSPRVIGGGRGYWWVSFCSIFVFCALFSDSDYPFGVFKLFFFLKLIETFKYL